MRLGSKHTLWGLLILAAAIYFGVAAGALEAASPEEDAAWLPESPAIRVAVKARQEVPLSCPARGIIKNLPVKDGGRFAKGDVLMELDCGILEAQTERVRAQAKRQRLIWESNQRLADLKSKSALEVTISQSEAEAAAAEALSMERMLAQCRLTAPFDGRVGGLWVTENQFVADGQPVMEILDDSELMLEFIVPSNWLSWLKPGYEFTLNVDETGSQERAVIDRLGGRVDPISQSIKAYARLVSPDPRLAPGMSGTADLTAPK